MAVCEIWDVRGRLDHPIDYAENPEKTANPKYTEADLQAMVDVMEYATNKNKTEQRFFVTGVNCDPTTARDEMMITKAGWSDTSEIVCYHGFQSFKHGEVTPEQAHEVGVKLAERMWGDRFQVIVATHLNTDCLHNHFVVNSVSFADGMHYHDNKANLRLLRQRSDELCREYALSVIEHPSGKKKPYALYQAEKQGRPTRDNVARQAVDEAISKSFTLKDFDRQLAEMGYRINFDPNRKYWTIIGKGWQRPKRLYKLGEEYTNDRIMERISENSYAVKFQSFSEPQPQVKVYRVKGSLKNAKKIGGLRGLYLHAAGFGSAQQTVLPQEIVTAVEDCGFFESIPLWAVTLIGGLFITVLSFIMIMSVYGRFFKLYIYTAIAPVPLSAFAGEPSQSVGKSFIKSYAAVCLEGAVIVLACIIFSLFASSPPVVNPDAAAVTMVWSYIGELVFNMLVLVGAVKMADRVVREMMGL